MARVMLASNSMISEVISDRNARMECRHIRDGEQTFYITCGIEPLPPRAREIDVLGQNA
jgi:hypothetical protein